MQKQDVLVGVEDLENGVESSRVVFTCDSVLSVGVGNVVTPLNGLVGPSVVLVGFAGVSVIVVFVGFTVALVVVVFCTIIVVVDG